MSYWSGYLPHGTAIPLAQFETNPHYLVGRYWNIPTCRGLHPPAIHNSIQGRDRKLGGRRPDYIGIVQASIDADFSEQYHSSGCAVLSRTLWKRGRWCFYWFWWLWMLARNPFFRTAGRNE